MTAIAIEARDLSVRFGAFVALESVSAAIPAGSYVAVIGPNGSGKSTLLNAMLGAQSPTTGEVRIFGHPAQDAPASAIGYLPQLKTLDRTFPAVAVELVVSGIRQSWPWRTRPHERERALAALSQTGVASVADRPIAALSGGQLQRVYLARSLVNRPKLLLLDEPGAGMDVAGEAAMYHLLEEYQRQTGATVVMVTHDWEGARAHATHALLVDHGLVAFGPAAETATSKRLLELFGHAGHVLATHGDGTNA
jgi:zinc transport system ATP-binding protein